MTVPTFDCTDCIIDQYLTLGGRPKEVRLFGAEIKSQLRLRETIAASVGRGAVLDLRGIRNRAIAADYSDLRSRPQIPPRHQRWPVRCQDGTHAHLGRRLQQSWPGSAHLPWTSVNAARARVDVPKRLFCNARYRQHSRSPADDILCWINDRRGFRQRDCQLRPRPFQLVASALETAGRSDTAVDVRIARSWPRIGCSQGTSGTVSKSRSRRRATTSGFGFHNEWALARFASWCSSASSRSSPAGRHTRATFPCHKPDVLALLWYHCGFGSSAPCRRSRSIRP